jgi:cell division protein FtsX
MFFLDIFRALKICFTKFLENIWLSLVTISIIILALIPVTSLLVFNLLADHILDKVQAKSEIYIDLTTKPNRLRLIISNGVSKLPDIREVRYVTPEETLARFREK